MRPLIFTILILIMSCKKEEPVPTVCYECDHSMVAQSSSNSAIAGQGIESYCVTDQEIKKILDDNNYERGGVYSSMTCKKKL